MIHFLCAGLTKTGVLIPLNCLHEIDHPFFVGIVVENLKKNILEIKKIHFLLAQKKKTIHFHPFVPTA